LRTSAPSSVYLPITLRWEVELLTLEGRWQETEGKIAEARVGIAQFYGQQHERYAGVLLAEANLRLAQQNVVQAEPLYQQVVNDWTAAGEEMPDSYVYGRLGLARVRLLQERPEEAEKLAAEVLARLLVSRQARSFLMQEAASRLWLGEAQRRQGKLAEALKNIRRAVALDEGMDDPASPWLAQARIVLADCLLDQNERREAADLLALSAEALTSYPQIGPQFLQPLQQAKARLLTIAHGA
jgi:tetratricopeptide (TPR) repeat protein